MGFPTSNFGLNAPISKAAVVTPSDSTVFTDVPRCLFIGTGGDITVDLYDGGTNIAYKNVADGTTFPRAVTRVYATGTTATDINAEW